MASICSVLVVVLLNSIVMNARLEVIAPRNADKKISQTTAKFVTKVAKHRG